MDYMRGDARNAGLYYLDGMPCMTPSTPALEPFATFTTTLAGEGPSAHHDADVAEDERKVDLLEELVYSRKKVAAWFLAGYGGSLCCPIILFSIDEAIFASYVFGGEAMAGIWISEKESTCVRNVRQFILRMKNTRTLSAFTFAIVSKLETRTFVIYVL